jgi:hypothetical protein
MRLDRCFARVKTLDPKRSPQPIAGRPRTETPRQEPIIRPPPLLGESARVTLSRWRHGLEPRLDCASQSRGGRAGWSASPPVADSFEGGELADDQSWV